MKRKLLLVAALLPIAQGCMMAIPAAATIGMMKGKENETVAVPPKSISIERSNDIIRVSAVIPARTMFQKGKMQDNTSWLQAAAIPTAEKNGCIKLRNISLDGDGTHMKKAMSYANIYNKEHTEEGIFRCITDSNGDGKNVADLKLTFATFLSDLENAGLLDTTAQASGGQ